MWRLCVLCVLLSPVQGKNPPPTPTSANGNSSDSHIQTQQSPVTGLDAGAGNHTARPGSDVLLPATFDHTDVYARPGSDVLLPATYNLTRHVDTSRCDTFLWSWGESAGESAGGVRITRGKRCEKPELIFTRFPNYNVSEDGRLSISNVTRNISGNYRFEVHNSNGVPKLIHSYTVHVEDPVSQPLLNVSCLPDGGAVIVCSIGSGDDPVFSISVNGRSLPENSTSSRTEENTREVHVPATSPRPWNITCSARNRVSDRESGKSQVKCAVPVSAPVLLVGCLHNGSLAMSCSVENGSDPIFSLSVNGKYLLVNKTKEEKRVNVTTSSPGPWDVHCSVGNSLMWKKTNTTSMACPVPPSNPVLKFSCHNGTLSINCSVEKGSNVSFSLSVNGTSLVENVTNGQRNINVTSSLSGPWDVHCSVENSLEERNTSSTYPSCSVSLSVPVINASCEINGTARVVCEVVDGSDATFTWTLNGEPSHRNSVPGLVINASDFASGAINVKCSAENSVSKEQSNETKIFCAAPVSEPVLNASCLSNGSAVVTCWLLSGTNPELSLTVNGQVIPLPNISSSSPRLKHIMSPGGPWNISCSVGNKLGMSVTHISNHSCSGSPPSSSCTSCLKKSVIGGVVALIVTTSPLLVAAFYIGRDTRRDH